MRKIDKGEFLQDLIVRAERQLNFINTDIRNLENEKLRWKAEQEWSIAECLEHLNTYSMYYLPLLEDKIKQFKTSDILDDFFLRGFVGQFFVKMMGNTKKYKAAKRHVPAGKQNPEITVTDFVRYQKQLLECLRFAKHLNLSECRIPISINRIIKLRLGDIFEFLIAHTERHTQQIKRQLTLSERSSAKTTLL
ncbi:hypothetical protein Pedsa_2040 [Pseudopedobacter saltans DSM 12145]|uniref:DinB-like domain-containing protein n=1 Tax=Pseudopedobacter saltans (strain ATCC 51119 / DSM 12145 / JCM 21818 / CCUG 39354 / LMG 10337 / NBRC 100064 / NCIMB 13643) TaxID=762903 RepID=F0SAH2_PSESL|nr:DinB family protein [Pseudopedobacter saltans]ADY52592.1 hypothetical protein Pedsa_2040 [Pseudopedobacter saltans DSM 12145]